ncbi:MAG TPA: MerR family transcriptional regulator [Pyrinomonadaceae bacterium]|jgi:DNA-binding transcriptional MerR regulator|nr:MerR family transcriptional regulator [Pyrinomonadaceae bacterium]
MMRNARNLRESATPEGGRELRIGEVARETGVGVETLRFYERRGLLGRPSRTEAGYRIYDASVLEQIAFIKRAQAIGFSLDEISEILRESASGRLPCREVREMARRKLLELEERLKELRRYRDELARTLRDWDERKEEHGRVCGLIEHSTIHSPDAARAGWRKKGASKKEGRR